MEIPVQQKLALPIDAATSGVRVSPARDELITNWISEYRSRRLLSPPVRINPEPLPQQLRLQLSFGEVAGEMLASQPISINTEVQSFENVFAPDVELPTIYASENSYLLNKEIVQICEFIENFAVSGEEFWQVDIPGINTDELREVVRKILQIQQVRLNLNSATNDRRPFRTWLRKLRSATRHSRVALGTTITYPQLLKLLKHSSLEALTQPLRIRQYLQLTPNKLMQFWMHVGETPNRPPTNLNETEFPSTARELGNILHLLPEIVYKKMFTNRHNTIDRRLERQLSSKPNPVGEMYADALPLRQITDLLTTQFTPLPEVWQTPDVTTHKPADNNRVALALVTMVLSDLKYTLGHTEWQQDDPHTIQAVIDELSQNCEQRLLVPIFNLVNFFYFLPQQIFEITHDQTLATKISKGEFKISFETSTETNLIYERKPLLSTQEHTFSQPVLEISATDYLDLNISNRFDILIEIDDFLIGIDLKSSSDQLNSLARIMRTALYHASLMALSSEKEIMFKYGSGKAYLGRKDVPWKDSHYLRRHRRALFLYLNGHTGEVQHYYPEFHQAVHHHSLIKWSAETILAHNPASKQWLEN